MTALPNPESSALQEYVKNAMTRDIYRVLFENRRKPLSIAEIRNHLSLNAGEQEHLNRRLRDLYPYFKISRIKQGRVTVYQLISVSDNPRRSDNKISKADRAWVLRDQRCAQCGRTPNEDKVRLHIDHIVPQDWGGNSERGNLQALCSECNEGKKNLFSSYNEYGDKIKEAINYDEPHKRIGELLKAFNGEAVPSELLELVAKAKQFQADWQKRLRELRELGWEYTFSKKRADGRVRTFFTLTKCEPWPEGKIAAAIRNRERGKGCEITKTD